MISVLITLAALPFPPDALARAEAERSGKLVAIALSSRVGESAASLDEYAFAAGEGSERIESRRTLVVARKDRPLLRPPMPKDRRKTDAYAMLRFIAPRLQESGTFSEPVLVADQEREDRELLLKEWARIMPGQTPPADLRVNFKLYGAVYIQSSDGKFFPLFVADGGAPSAFDAAAELDLDPVPTALRRAVEGRTVAASGTLSLAEWTKRVAAATGLSLAVDARASDWATAIETPSGRARTADLLEGVARAHRLYWRSVGEDRWLLAAAPDGELPSDWAASLLKREALARIFEAIGPLVRAGKISAEFARLLTATPGPIGRMRPGERRDLESVLRDAKPIEEGRESGASFSRFREDTSAFERASWSVGLYVLWNLKFDGNSIAGSVELP